MQAGVRDHWAGKVGLVLLHIKVPPAWGGTGARSVAVGRCAGPPPRRTQRQLEPLSDWLVRLL